MKQKAYISGKITGLQKSEYEQMFEEAEKVAIELLHEPVNPVKLNHNHDKSWEAYMREDIKAMMECHYLIMLRNWKESRGAIIEHDLAKNLNINIIYL